MSERHPAVIDERTFQRRRLGVLAGLLALVLAASPLLGGADRDGAGDVQVAAHDEVIRAAAIGSPTEIRELLSETTTTLVEATGATTATTAPIVVAPATTVAPDPEPDAAAATDEADEPEEEPEVDEPEPAPATAARTPATTAPPTTQAPAPKRAPATTTTTAPARTTSEGYAYDDPRSTQVWYDLAGCEAGGNWSIDSGNGYYGGLQFSLGAWQSVGGSGHPHEHPAATQIEMGRRLQARQGWGAWPHCAAKLGLD